MFRFLKLYNWTGVMVYFTLIKMLQTIIFFTSLSKLEQPVNKPKYRYRVLLLHKHILINQVKLTWLFTLIHAIWCCLIRDNHLFNCPIVTFLITKSELITIIFVYTFNYRNLTDLNLFSIFNKCHVFISEIWMDNRLTM